MVAKALRLWQDFWQDRVQQAPAPKPREYVSLFGVALPLPGAGSHEIKGAVFISLIVIVGVFDPAFFQIIASSIADAYLQVSVFVAATLGLFYIAETYWRLDTAGLMRRYRSWQVPVAAILGVLPGCGGAVIVITHYITGKVGFGAMVAVLIATMGDAAFLLLAREPQTGIAIFALSLGVGILSGYAVEALHGPDFLRRRPEGTQTILDPSPQSWTGNPPSRFSKVSVKVWSLLLIPGCFLGILGAAQIDTDALWGALSPYQPTAIIGLLGGVLSIVMWVTRRGPVMGINLGVDSNTPLRERVATDTNFITVWVVGGFLAYESLVYFTDFDLRHYFQSMAVLAPLIGVLVGFLPGCGPQVVMTTLYLNGVIPLSAQLANAIANDGDALFPAIALAPRAAVIATLYSAIPALLVGYAWFFFVE